MSYRYIPLSEDSKKPEMSWGGWPIDPDHSHIYDREQVESSDWDHWAIVGNDTGNLLVIDVDLYKFDNETMINKLNDGAQWFGLLDQTRIVTTQSGGVHVYFEYDGGQIPETIQYVDLKGDVGKGYVAAPVTPGYELANDLEPIELEHETLQSLPVFTDNYVHRKQHANPIRTITPCAQAADRNDPDGQWLLNALRQNRDDYVDIYDIIPRAGYPPDTNHPHPFHPSDTGHNFRVDGDGMTFRCWRHEVTGNGLHLAGIEGGIIECGDWKFDDIDYGAIREYAENQGYITEITCEKVQARGLCPHICGKTPTGKPRKF